MIKVCRMNVLKGFEKEYQKRHDEIPDELKSLLKNYGISEYRIYLDAESNALFAIFHIEDERRLKDLATEPVMKKWWAFMKDIMPSNADNSPKSYELKEVFYLA